MTTRCTSRQLATNYEILVARTEFLVALATRKAQFRTLLVLLEANEKSIIFSSLFPIIKV